MEIAKITSNGQITIPLEIRKQLNLQPGDKVLFIKENGKITLTNSDSLEEQLQELAHDPEIQREISAINQEFENTEIDGLEEL